jgi:hypothetical protein
MMRIKNLYRSVDIDFNAYREDEEIINEYRDKIKERI